MPQMKSRGLERLEKKNSTLEAKLAQHAGRQDARQRELLEMGSLGKAIALAEHRLRVRDFAEKNRALLECTPLGRLALQRMEREQEKQEILEEVELERQNSYAKAVSAKEEATRGMSHMPQAESRATFSDPTPSQAAARRIVAQAEREKARV